MSTTKHSPGPWAVKSNNKWAVVDADSNIVVITTMADDSPIIAAAPELLALLKKAYEVINNFAIQEPLSKNELTLLSKFLGEIHSVVEKAEGVS